MQYPCLVLAPYPKSKAWLSLGTEGGKASISSHPCHHMYTINSSENKSKKASRTRQGKRSWALGVYTKTQHLARTEIGSSPGFLNCVRKKNRKRKRKYFPNKNTLTNVYIHLKTRFFINNTVFEKGKHLNDFENTSWFSHQFCSSYRLHGNEVLRV